MNTRGESRGCSVSSLHDCVNGSRTHLSLDPQALTIQGHGFRRSISSLLPGRIAYNMINDAEQKGLITPGKVRGSEGRACCSLAQCKQWQERRAEPRTAEPLLVRSHHCVWQRIKPTLAMKSTTQQRKKAVRQARVRNDVQRTSAEGERGPGSQPAQ